MWTLLIAVQLLGPLLLPPQLGRGYLPSRTTMTQLSLLPYFTSSRPPIDSTACTASLSLLCLGRSSQVAGSSLPRRSLLFEKELLVSSPCRTRLVQTNTALVQSPNSRCCYHSSLPLTRPDPECLTAFCPSSASNTSRTTVRAPSPVLVLLTIIGRFPSTKTKNITCLRPN